MKSLRYFEAVSTLALFIGLIAVHLWKPGEGLNINAASLDSKITESYVAKGAALSSVDILLNIIPRSFLDAFVTGDILQVAAFANSRTVLAGPMGDLASPQVESVCQ